MSASPLSQKSQTKLKTFLKEKEKPAKRFKSLVSFIESATKEELKAFFVEKYEQIFAVLLARFADLESSQKKDKKQHIPNVQSVIAVLKQFILLLHPQIKKKWQYANLSRVMDSCLNEYNKHCVRKDGLDLLLTFMEVLGEQMEEQVGKFAAAIIYEPFLRPEEEKSENRLSEKEREREDKRKRADPSFASSPEMACLAPGHQSPTRSDAVELTKYYFEFISRPERMGKFEFWFELWKQSYFSLFFPNISLELGIIERIEEKRFEESCPAEMIAALVEQVAIWTDDSTLNPIIWSNTNGPLLMEISRQACRLPVAQHVIIKQSMDVFKNILLVRFPP